MMHLCPSLLVSYSLESITSMSHLHDCALLIIWLTGCFVFEVSHTLCCMRLRESCRNARSSLEPAIANWSSLKRHATPKFPAKVGSILLAGIMALLWRPIFVGTILL